VLPALVEAIHRGAMDAAGGALGPWGGPIRVVLVVAAGVGLWFAARVLGPRLFPPRCPECRTPLRRNEETIYEGEERPTIVLPPMFETGKRSRWPGAHGDSPEEMRANVSAMMEWDRTLERLRNEYETDGEKETD